MKLLCTFWYFAFEQRYQTGTQKPSYRWKIHFYLTLIANDSKEKMKDVESCVAKCFSKYAEAKKDTLTPAAASRDKYNVGMHMIKT